MIETPSPIRSKSEFISNWPFERLPFLCQSAETCVWPHSSSSLTDSYCELLFRKKLLMNKLPFPVLMWWFCCWLNAPCPWGSSSAGRPSPFSALVAPPAGKTHGSSPCPPRSTEQTKNRKAVQADFHNHSFNTNWNTSSGDQWRLQVCHPLNSA